MSAFILPPVPSTGFVPAGPEVRALHLEQGPCARGLASCGIRSALQFLAQLERLFDLGDPSSAQGYNFNWACAYRNELQRVLPQIMEDLLTLSREREGFHCLSRAVLAITFRNTIDTPAFFSQALELGKALLENTDAPMHVSIRDLGHFVYGLFNVGYCDKALIESALDLVREREPQILALLRNEHVRKVPPDDHHLSDLLDGLSKIAWVACAQNLGARLINSCLDPSHLGAAKLLPVRSAARVLQTHLTLAHIEDDAIERRICGCPRPESAISQAWFDPGGDLLWRERLLANSRQHRNGGHEPTQFEREVHLALTELGPQNVVMLVEEPHLLEFDVDFSLHLKLQSGGAQYLVPMALEADGSHHWVGWDQGQRQVARGQVESRLLSKYCIAPVRIPHRDWQQTPRRSRAEFLGDRLHSCARAYVKRWVA